MTKNNFGQIYATPNGKKCLQPWNFSSILMQDNQNYFKYLFFDKKTYSIFLSTDQFFLFFRPNLQVY